MKEEKLHTHDLSVNISSSSKEWGIITCFFILAISVVMQFYILVAVPEELSAQFRLPISNILRLTAMFGFFYAAGLLIWGGLASIYDTKYIMLIGLFLLSAAAFLWLKQHNIDLIWFRIIAIPFVMLSLLSSSCIKKFGSLSMVWFSTLLLTIGHALQLLALINPGSWIYAAHAVYAAGIGLAVPSLISFIGLSTPPKIKGTALSLYMFILFFGGGVGTFLIFYTGVIPMMIVQVSIFVFLMLWLGVTLAMRRRKTIPLVLAASILPISSFAADSPTTMENALMYYKELSPKEEQQYNSLLIASGKKTSGKVKTENITLYRWQRSPELALGHDNVSFQVTDKGQLTGFARYIPSAASEPLPSREETERIARAFLQQHAPDLLPVMNLQWVNPHRDETYTDGNTNYRINGMKMKCRSSADGTYFWVIVGSDNSVIVFERDIEWDFIRAGRQTEKWLHDDWLQKNKIQFTKQ